MKFNSNNVSFNFSGSTETIKNQYTIEKPYKMVTKNAKNIFEFSTFVSFFGAIFEKVVFLKNGCGRYQTGATPSHFVFIFHET